MTRPLLISLVATAAISFASALAWLFLARALDGRSTIVAQLASSDMQFVGIAKRNPSMAFPVGDEVLDRAADVRVGGSSSWRRDPKCVASDPPARCRVEQLYLVPPQGPGCRALDLALWADGKDSSRWVLSLSPSASCPGWQLLLGHDGQIPDAHPVAPGALVEVTFDRPDSSGADVFEDVTAAELHANHPPRSTERRLASLPDNVLRGGIRMARLTAGSIPGARAPALIAELHTRPFDRIIVDGSDQHGEWAKRMWASCACVGSSLASLLIAVLGLCGKGTGACFGRRRRKPPRRTHGEEGGERSSPSHLPPPASTPAAGDTKGV